MGWMWLILNFDKKSNSQEIVITRWSRSNCIFGGVISIFLGFAIAFGFLTKISKQKSIDVLQLLKQIPNGFTISELLNFSLGLFLILLGVLLFFYTHYCCIDKFKKIVIEKKTTIFGRRKKNYSFDLFQQLQIYKMIESNRVSNNNQTGSGLNINISRQRQRYVYFLNLKGNNISLRLTSSYNCEEIKSLANLVSEQMKLKLIEEQ